MINVSVLGYGTVGSGVLILFVRNNAMIRQNASGMEDLYKICAGLERFSGRSGRGSAGT